MTTKKGKGKGRGPKPARGGKPDTRAPQHHVPAPPDAPERLHGGDDRLKQPSDHYRALFNNPHECVYILDLEGRYLEINSGMLNLLGYSRQELLGMNYIDLLVDDQKEKARAISEEVRSNGRTEHARDEWTLKKKNGDLLYLDVTGSLLYHEGQPCAILGIARDITAARHTAEALKASEERYRLVIENSDQSILVVQNTLIKWINNRLTELTGYQANELLGTPFIDYIFSDDRSMVYERHKRRIAGENVPTKYPFRLTHKSGEIKWVEVSATFLQWEGRPATLNFLTDITERVQAEEDLKESNLQYQNIIDFLPDATFVIDNTGTVIAWNRAIEDMTGVSKADMLGKGNYEYSLPFYGERRKILIDYVMENAPDAELRYFNIERSGSTLYAEAFVPELRDGRGAYCFVKASRLYNSRGELTGAIEAIRDTTEMKLAEHALRESEKRYRDIFENSLDGMFQSTPEGIFISVNKALAQMYGVATPEEFLKEISDIPLHLYANPAKRKDLVHTIQREGIVNNFETEFLRKDGSKFWVSITARTVTDEQGRVIRYEGSVKDINRRKTAEDELNRLQVMYKATLESTGDGVIVTDSDGRILLTNSRFAEMWRLPVEIVRAPHLDDIIEYIYNELEDPRTFIDNLHKLTSNSGIETSTIRFKDGRIFERFSTPLIINDNVAGRVCSYRDVTAMRLMEDELYRTQKLDSLGILAGGIAHDFNNILTGILGNITLARMEAQPDTSMHAILDEAEKAAVRAKDLTQQLLTFARGGAPIKKTASISDVLLDTVQFALRGSKSRCEFHVPQDLWHAEIDRGQISQVINNMVINSDEAMPQGGAISISAENLTLEEETTSLAPGRYIKISISDSGLGIPDDHISRIFDPYFTTKQKGSGLGLATSYSIIKKHGGTITVSSQLGAGSTFNIFIPASEERMEQTVTQPKQERKRQGRILIMDDEAMVLEVAARMLRHIGYSDIQTAADGKEAIEAYRSAKAEGNPFTIVIMDLTVPGGMGGEEAVKTLLEMDPEVKVIVSSGYSSGPVLSDYRKFGFSAVAGKPYTVDELERALDEALNI